MVKIGAMSICLQPLLAGEVPTGERLLRAAAEVGVDGVEFYETHWGADPRDVDGAAAAVGAQVVTFPAIDSQPVPEGRTAEAGGLHFAQGVGPLIEQVQELAEFAAGYNVRLALLNHCFFVGASWHQEWVVKLADRPEVGTCLDPGNYLYYECEDPVSATRRLAGTVCNVRLGDWVRRGDREVIEAFRTEGRLGIWAPAVFGEGAVDHGACLQVLHESGYEGYLTMKSVGGDFHRSLEGVRALVEAASIV